MDSPTLARRTLPAHMLVRALDDEALITLARSDDQDAEAAAREYDRRHPSVMGALDNVLAAADRFDAALAVTQ
jgi:hypothetical protein